MKLLFVCSKNRWRSPTAEQLFSDHPEHEARSCGTEAGSRTKLSLGLVKWADVIYVMQEKHRHVIQQRFGDEAKKIINLNIQDEYPAMDPRLIAKLRKKLAPLLE